MKILIFWVITESARNVHVDFV